MPFQADMFELGAFGLFWLLWMVASLLLPIAAVVFVFVAYREWKRHTAALEDALNAIARQLAARRNESASSG